MVLVEWKGENTNPLECESCTLKWQHVKMNLKVLKTLVWYMVKVSWETCD
jgi:hypothetical protein